MTDHLDRPSDDVLALHWIDGKWVDSAEHGTSVDPATGAPIGRFAVGDYSDAECAVAAAKHAFQHTAWKTDRALRSRVLNNMADRFEVRLPELVERLGLENGKVREHAQLEVSIVPETLRMNAALALSDFGRAMQVSADGLDLVVKQAAGVVGVIAPWNSPVALSIRSLAPALAAGATAVVSLPRQTAQTNTLIAEIISETPELPTGVVNVVTGGRATGDALVKSPDVPVISFTGSTATGKEITRTAAEHLKRLGLELGGKTPMVVFDDADLLTALPLIVSALTVFAGQFCMTGRRLIVQDTIADDVRSRLVELLDAVVVGPAADPTSQMGPLIDRANVERVDAMVERAIAAGATPLLRGGPISDGLLAAGAFYRPTLLEVQDPAAEIVQQEVFGPVLTLQVFHDEAEALQLANDTDYGLAASVFSRDAERPLRVALAIEAGTVWVNQWGVLHDQFEEGGFKSSGAGRMRGLAVVDDFIEYKHIALKIAG